MRGCEAIPVCSLCAAEVVGEISPWCHSEGKRIFDVCVGLPLLLATTPLLLLIGASIKLTSKGPILFRQNRVGLRGKEFQLFKFRTMSHRNRQSGPGVTRAGDARITRLGQILRGSKLDELPQLFNLLRGDMSLVGPRPDLAEFLRDVQPSAWRMLSLKPGITGWATLHFRKEEQLLAAIPEEQVRHCYVNEILPRKIELDLEYAAKASFLKDCAILFQTALAIFR
jgi:lipopolysaccharide/colanic/teichoic acid biosynthesis glycosyltransferase